MTQINQNALRLLHGLAAALLLLPSNTVAAEASDKVDAAIAAAVEGVCMPHLLGETSDRKDELGRAQRLGFGRVSPQDSLSGIGEDLHATFGPAKISVTLWDEDWDENKVCGVSVRGDPKAFDRYLERLLAGGWISAGAPVTERGTRNERLWAPDGRFTIIAGRYAGEQAIASPERVLSLVLELGKNSISPVCSPTQPAPCRKAYVQD